MDGTADVITVHTHYTDADETQRLWQDAAGTRHHDALIITPLAMYRVDRTIFNSV